PVRPQWNLKWAFRKNVIKSFFRGNDIRQGTKISGIGAITVKQNDVGSLRVTDFTKSADVCRAFHEPSLITCLPKDLNLKSFHEFATAFSIFLDSSGKFRSSAGGRRALH